MILKYSNVVPSLGRYLSLYPASYHIITAIPLLDDPATAKIRVMNRKTKPGPRVWLQGIQEPELQWLTLA